MHRLNFTDWLPRALAASTSFVLLMAAGCGQQPTASPPSPPVAAEVEHPGHVAASGAETAHGEATVEPPLPVGVAETGVNVAETNPALTTEKPGAATTATNNDATEAPSAVAEKIEKPAPPPPETAGLKRLTPDYEVWADFEKKRVLVGGQVVRQEGQLEMFACLKNTKEHESVVAVNSKAFVINAALMALGALPGTPVQFRPEFKPANGPEVEVTVIWTDAAGKRRQARAQEWIRHMKTGKQMEQPWVFGGSGFWVDEATGEKHFMAEDGDFICISNFNSAMLDLPVESSQASSDLQFDAFTERIPPVKTPVVLVLTPKIKKPVNAEAPKAE